MHLGRCLLLALVFGAQAMGEEPAKIPQSPAGHVRLELIRGPGAESCPAASAIEGELQARLGYDPFRANARRSVHVSVERTGAALRANVELWDGELLVGEQQLKSATADCGDLVPALELVIGLAIDRASLGEPEPLAPQEIEAAQTIVPAVQVPAAVAEKTPAHESEPLHLAVTLGVVGAVDAAPAPSFGFTLGLEGDWKQLSLGLEGRADLPAGKAVPEVNGSIRTALIFGSLVPCFHEAIFAGCGLIALGVEQGSGAGYAGALSGSKFYSALGLRAQVDPLSAGPLMLRLHLDLLVPLNRTDVQVLNGKTVWSTPAVSLALGAEAVFRFR